jgi:hypothetical protein
MRVCVTVSNVKVYLLYMLYSKNDDFADSMILVCTVCTLPTLTYFYRKARKTITVFASTYDSIER